MQIVGVKIDDIINLLNQCVIIKPVSGSFCFFRRITRAFHKYWVEEYVRSIFIFSFILQ